MTCNEEVRACVETGGEWDEGSCGHYACGVRPICRAVVAGCNCGEGRNFFEGVGCVADATCECDQGDCCVDEQGRLRGPDEFYVCVEECCTACRCADGGIACNDACEPLPRVCRAQRTIDACTSVPECAWRNPGCLPR